ncbi:hypothetical protein HDA32_003161 [Spinactinospora alkalitolerans]|uniref:Amidohydrolase 3 domain-containing protein n=1 Tax=Spinactinospora alkalitolerans TaxID=687207 RepID=A0A852TWD9_9ACTN|nr:amidohydrolase [Spinactinospora alkalitolerans]NYE48041.1 hypothetical protein [Spinactinospora alkalitolerans]
MQKSDLLIINAVVRTMDSQDSVHSAVLVSDGVIAAVGSDAELRTAADQATVFDAQGGTLTPGFIDNHNHLLHASFMPLDLDCSTPSLATLNEVLERIEQHCRTMPAGRWLQGFGFAAAKIREGRNPTRYELDEVAPHNPFILVESNTHVVNANSAALETGGIGECSPNPWGGEIERDRHGVPTGTLFETAAHHLQSIGWERTVKRDWEAATALVEAKSREYLSHGITAIGDAAVTPVGTELYQRAAKAGRLPLTVHQIHAGDAPFFKQDLRRGDFIDRVHQDESRMLRTGAMKIWADRAYPDGPGLHKIHDGCQVHAGQNFYSPYEIRDLTQRATDLDIGLVIHAMGNCSIDSVTDAYELVRRQHGYDSILRIEHAFVAEPAQAPRMADLAIDLVANPGLAYNDGLFFNSWRGEGQDHLKVLPLRSMIDAGVRVSLASDNPCGFYHPIGLIWSAVTRKHYSGVLIDPDEAITPLEALRAFTSIPAVVAGREHEEGSIEVGKRANLVLLDADPLTVVPDDIVDITVLKTFVDGVEVYDSAAADPFSRVPKTP